VNKRRKLFIAFGAGALVMPLPSFAQQQGKIWRIGFLFSGNRPTPVTSHANYRAFSKGMQELGHIEGKNLMIELRFAEGRAELLSVLAAELVQLNLDVIIANGTPAASALQKATATIPIVFGSAGDPVGSGLVKSLARPGGNITGLTNVSGDLSRKHLEMLLEMVPKLSRVAVLVNPDNPAHTTIIKNVQAAALGAGIKMSYAEARTPQEIEIGFSRISRENAGAVIVEPDGFFNKQARQIAENAAKHRLASIAGTQEFAEAGGLISYGTSFADMYRRAATYVDKILKGAKPADLPVEQPTKFELVINAKTAKALGLKIPQSLLISADQVIE
jgi:putative ABC transport system substrate-binding protein